MSIGKKIRELRKGIGLRQKELAAKLRVSENSVYYWEHDERSPRKKQRKILCDFFNITEAELFGGIPKDVVKDHLEKARHIHVVGKVSAGNLMTYKHPTEVELPSYTKVSNCDAVTIVGDSMRPLAQSGNFVLFNRKINTFCDPNCVNFENQDKLLHKNCIRHNDLVYVKLKNNGSYFKRYYDFSSAHYKNMTPELKIKLTTRNKKAGITEVIALASVNEKDYDPILTSKDEIEFIYKVVGIIY